MKKIGIILAIISALTALGVIVLRTARAADVSNLQTLEYATIRWAGRENTHLIRPNGQVEFLGPLLVAAKRPERVDERAFYLTIAVNAVTREGFEVAAMTESTVLLRRPVPK